MLIKHISKALLTALIFFSFVSSISTEASSSNVKIDQRSTQQTRDIIQKISKNDPQKPESQKLTKNPKDKNEITSEQNNLKVKFNLKSKKIKLENKDKGDVTIGIPNESQYDSVDNVDNKLVYTGKNSKTDIIVESVDGGLRQIINIKDKTAPNFYDFPVDLQPEETIILSSEGGATIQSSKLDETTNLPKIKLQVGKPWAKDANGKDLKTWYTVEKGNILRQTIDLNNAVFPVTADPIWCGTAINYVNWIRRYGVWSASNKPTWCGYWHCGSQWSCWQESYDKTSKCAQYSGNTCVTIPWNKEWNTNQYWSMYNQFMCHADFAKGGKFEWNLEPSKADKGYWGFANFSSKCN